MRRPASTPRRGWPSRRARTGSTSPTSRSAWRRWFRVSSRRPSTDWPRARRTTARCRRHSPAQHRHRSEVAHIARFAEVSRQPQEAAMRKFSVRPTLTLRGRKFKGLRGWSGKPTHPPLTDLPVAAYILAAVFDIIAVLGRNEAWARDFFRAGTFVFIGGAAVSVLAALTGFWDWLRSTEKGTQARRTANTHAW